eukprot:TRINITY_DN21821_c0_g3_i1.p1 TRINITY_DN21821_c0_g3~~TRINITY_DN21821_c0_g3_i1.p1  ORF type:complete len:849 (-),score=161.54 TRINITY_DN21821_c0_g3_i1:159-2372(-)
MRCSKCWECPLCASKLNISSFVKEGAVPVETFYMTCYYCHWSSRGWLESDKQEPLIAEVVTLEREGESTQRMSALVTHFKRQAQEQQREKELKMKLQNKALTRGTFVANVLGNFVARRYSSAYMLSQGRRNSPRGDLTAVGEQADNQKGRWNLENLAEKLEMRAEAVKDIRFEAKMVAERGGGSAQATPRVSVDASAAAGASTGAGATGVKAGAGAGDRPSLSSSAASALPRASLLPLPGGEASPTRRLSVLPNFSDPTMVLNGLTAEEMVMKHATGLVPSDLRDPSAKKSLVDLMQQQLDSGLDPPLGQKLQQFSLGRTRLARTVGADPAPAGALRTAEGQLEGAALHIDPWTMLPVRKPLLTRRSRRCRLPGREDPSTPCGKIVVKPQINPCTNPSFQKCYIAPSFVPRFSPFLWKASNSADIVVGNGQGLEQARERGLDPGEGCEMVFIMANVMDSEVALRLDATAFNFVTGGPPTGEQASGARKTLLDFPAAMEQNVEVQTGLIQTTIEKFQDFGDEVGEETDKNKQLASSDDKDIFPNRKMHKLLCRLRFKRPANATAPAPWVFYARLGLTFTDVQQVKHEVEHVVRFAAPTVLAAAPEAASRLSRLRDMRSQVGSWAARLLRHGIRLLPDKSASASLEGKISISIARWPLDAVVGLDIAVVSASGTSGEGGGLRILHVREGLVHAHNQAHADQMVEPGAVIVEVNGASITEKMLEALTDVAAPALDLTLRR